MKIKVPCSLLNKMNSLQHYTWSVTFLPCFWCCWVVYSIV